MDDSPLTERIALLNILFGGLGTAVGLWLSAMLLAVGGEMLVVLICGTLLATGVLGIISGVMLRRASPAVPAGAVLLLGLAVVAGAVFCVALAVAAAESGESDALVLLAAPGTPILLAAIELGYLLSVRSRSAH